MRCRAANTIELMFLADGAGHILPFTSSWVELPTIPASERVILAWTKGRRRREPSRWKLRLVREPVLSCAPTSVHRYILVYWSMGPCLLPGRLLDGPIPIILLIVHSTPVDSHQYFAPLRLLWYTCMLSVLCMIGNIGSKYRMYIVILCVPMCWMFYVDAGDCLWNSEPIDLTLI